MRKKFVQIQKTKVLKKARLDYTLWKNAGGDGEEHPEAEPDSVIVDPQPYSDQLDAILEVLDEGGESILTDNQKHVFQMVVREGISIRETARMLRRNESSVRESLKTAIRKLRKLCQPKL